MNKKHVLLLGLFLLPILLLIWEENVDPPFITNSAYDLLLFNVIPALSALLSVVLFVFSYHRYKHNSRYRHVINTQLCEHGKIRCALSSLFVPLIIYIWIFAAVIAPVRLLPYYAINGFWSQEYRLSDVGDCASDYESECVHLTLLDLTTAERHTVRWYADKPVLLTLKNKNILVIGEQSYFGYIISGFSG